MFSQVARMILRQLERRPLKSLMTSLGIALAVSVLVLGTFMEDALEYIIDYQFNLSQRQDVMISLVEPTSGRSLYEIGQLPGVQYVEPFRTVPTRLRFGPRSRRVGVLGLVPGGTLYRLLDDREREVALPSKGLALSSKLAELLEVGLGDVLTVEVLEGERPVREVPVTRLITEFGGLNAYMDIRALRRMMREGPTVSGAFLAVDELHVDKLYATLKVTPRVASVNVKAAAVKSFQETIMENLMRMRAYNVLFATIIAVGVVYNSARISFAERARELATMRVIGFTRGEVSAILMGELAILTLAAIPVGLVIGHGFAALAALGLDTELYRIPLVIDRSTYAFAAAVVMIAALLSGLVVRRRIDRLDLVAVLKAAE